MGKLLIERDIYMCTCSCILYVYNYIIYNFVEFT